MFLHFILDVSVNLVVLFLTSLSLVWAGITVEMKWLWSWSKFSPCVTN